MKLHHVGYRIKGTEKSKFTGNEIDGDIVNQGLIHGNIRNTLSRVISVSRVMGMKN